MGSNFLWGKKEETEAARGGIEIGEIGGKKEEIQGKQGEDWRQTRRDGNSGPKIAAVVVISFPESLLSVTNRTHSQ